MKYYRVKKAFDGVKITKTDRNGKQRIFRQLIGNELYTASELHRLFVGATIHARDDSILFDVVDIPKSKIFWNFGVRFEIKGA